MAGRRRHVAWSSLATSERSFRRQCQATIGVGPKALQRMLRFQGFLARVQYAVSQGRPPAGEGLALLAAETGYADQAHLTRECVRLTGVTPRVFLRETAEVCGCVPAPHVTTFRHVWAYDHAARVIGAWQQWSPDAPDRLAASLLVTVPAAERPPVLNVFGASTGGESETSDLLGGLAELAGPAPASTVMTPAPYAAAKRYLADLGDEMASASAESAHNLSRSEYFDGPLPGDAVAALVRNLDADRRPGQARELDFTPWGGAYTRVPVDATAFPHRDARFLLKHTVAVAADASSRDRETARGWLHRSWATVHPWGSGGVYPNFPDPDLTSWADAYHGPNIERLRRVKAAYDPDGFFRFH